MGPAGHRQVRRQTFQPQWLESKVQVVAVADEAIPVYQIGGMPNDHSSRAGAVPTRQSLDIGAGRRKREPGVIVAAYGQGASTLTVLIHQSQPVHLHRTQDLSSELVRQIALELHGYSF